jgi:hypothetical protein
VGGKKKLKKPQDQLLMGDGLGLPLLGATGDEGAAEVLGCVGMGGRAGRVGVSGRWRG